MNLPAECAPVDAASSQSGCLYGALHPLSDLLSEFRCAWQTHSCERLARLVTSRVTWINRHGEITCGAAELSEHLLGTLCPPFDPDISRDEAQQLQVSVVQPIGDDLLSVTLMTDRPSRRVSVSLLVVRDRDYWRICQGVVSRLL